MKTADIRTFSELRDAINQASGNIYVYTDTLDVNIKLNKAEFLASIEHITKDIDLPDPAFYTYEIADQIVDVHV